MRVPDKHFGGAAAVTSTRRSDSAAGENVSRPVRLELRTEGVTRRFTFLSENECAIVVGSLLRADLRINHPGVTPVHFQFERRGEQVFLVPTNGVELQLNGAPVVGPCAIGERAVIEFLGIVVAGSASGPQP